MSDVYTRHVCVREREGGGVERKRVSVGLLKIISKTRGPVSTKHAKRVWMA